MSVSFSKWKPWNTPLLMLLFIISISIWSPTAYQIQEMPTNAFSIVLKFHGIAPELVIYPSGLSSANTSNDNLTSESPFLFKAINMTKFNNDEPSNNIIYMEDRSIQYCQPSPLNIPVNH